MFDSGAAGAATARTVIWQLNHMHSISLRADPHQQEPAEGDMSESDILPHKERLIVPQVLLAIIPHLHSALKHDEIQAFPTTISAADLASSKMRISRL